MRLFWALLASLSIPGSAAAAWARVETPNFVVLGEVGEKRTGDVALEFERFREALARLLPGANRQSPVPTIVVAFRSQKSLAPYRLRRDGKPIDVSGFFAWGGDHNLIAVAVDSRSDEVLFHEYTHLVVANAVGRVPAWFAEGIADFYSSFEVIDGGRGAAIGKPLLRHVRLLNESARIPLDEFLTVDSAASLTDRDGRRTLFYAQSWALVHLLVTGEPSRASELMQYAQLVSSGVESVAAWRRVFGDLDVNRLLRNHVENPVQRSFRVRFRDELPATRGAATVPAPADVQAVLGAILQRVGDKTEAEEQLTGAAASTPASPLASALLAALRVEQDRPSEARPLLQKAAAGAPDDWLTQYYVGSAFVRALDARDQDEKTDAETALRAVDRVLASRPDLPNALALKARLLLLTGGPSDEALQTIRRARALAPGREEYAFTEADLLVRRQEFGAARAVLGPLMTNATPAPFRNFARQLMGVIADAENRSARRAAPAAETSAASPARTSATNPPPTEVPRYRDLGPGEQRVEGELQRIECAARRATLHVRTGDRLARYTAPGLDKIEFITYREDLRGTVACGPRRQPERVFVTWRAPAVAGNDGIAVAVEFVRPEQRIP